MKGNSVPEHKQDVTKVVSILKTAQNVDSLRALSATPKEHNSVFASVKSDFNRF